VYDRGEKMRAHFGALLLTLAVTAPACDRAANDRQRFPAATGYVSDYANLLRSSSKQELQDLLRSVENDTSAEVAVLTVNSLEGMSIDDYARRVFNIWGVGKKHADNGVLIVVARQERETRIQVGYGLESVVTDELAQAAIDTKLLPAFRSNDFARGLRDGVGVVAETLRRDRQLSGKQQGRVELPRRRMVALTGATTGGGVSGDPLDHGSGGITSTIDVALGRLVAARATVSSSAVEAASAAERAAAGDALPPQPSRRA
jgi:uncharacterized membrane protein YgcG